MRKTVLGKFRKAAKLEKRKRKALVIVVGENLAEIRPTSALAKTCPSRPRCDSSEVMIQKICPGEFRKAVKLEKRKPLVIVAGGNMAEIRPPSENPQNRRR